MKFQKFINEKKICTVCGHNQAQPKSKYCVHCKEELEMQKLSKTKARNKKNITIDVDKLKPER